MSDLKFSTADVPEQIFSKASAPNPFTEQIDALVKSAGEDGNSAVASTVVVPDDEVSKRVGQIRKAGELAGVTARKKITENGDGTSAITFWTTPRIVRPRKDKDTE